MSLKAVLKKKVYINEKISIFVLSVLTLMTLRSGKRPFKKIRRNREEVDEVEIHKNDYLGIVDGKIKVDML